MVKKENTIITVGSLLPYKGHDLIIKAIGILKDKFKLTIVGGGRKSEKKRILDLGEKNGVEIKIYNKVDDKKLNKLYNSSLIYINASYKEPFGLSTLEALASGTKAITVDDGGTKELKKFFKKNIMVVNRDPKSIARGILRATKNRTKIKINIPKMFHWENTVREIIKYIDEN